MVIELRWDGKGTFRETQRSKGESRRVGVYGSVGDRGCRAWMEPRESRWGEREGHVRIVPIEVFIFERCEWRGHRSQFGDEGGAIANSKINR